MGVGQGRRREHCVAYMNSKSGTFGISNHVSLHCGEKFLMLSACFVLFCFKQEKKRCWHPSGLSEVHNENECSFLATSRF